MSSTSWSVNFRSPRPAFIEVILYVWFRPAVDISGVLEHHDIFERREKAVVGIGGGEGNVPQGWDLSLPISLAASLANSTGALGRVEKAA